MVALHYKVVTSDLKSLGLRNNPTILQYKIGEWIESPVVLRNGLDEGGIWVCRTMGSANQLRKYMKKQHDKVCRIFKVEIGEYLFGNTYRIKTDKVLLIEEI